MKITNVLRKLSLIFSFVLFFIFAESCTDNTTSSNSTGPTVISCIINGINNDTIVFNGTGILQNPNLGQIGDVLQLNANQNIGGTNYALLLAIVYGNNKETNGVFPFKSAFVVDTAIYAYGYLEVGNDKYVSGSGTIKIDSVKGGNLIGSFSMTASNSQGKIITFTNGVISYTE